MAIAAMFGLHRAGRLLLNVATGGYARLVRRALPIDLRLNGQPIRSTTTIVRVDAYTWALSTSLPDQALELYSSYLGSEHAGDVALSRLCLSPTGRDITTRQLPYTQLPVGDSPRVSIYDHLQALQDAVLDADLGTLRVEDLAPALTTVGP